MNHRHLLPNEIDLLVDGEVGFGVAPLRAHVDECERCREELEEARSLVQMLEDLPHLAPSPLFAERLMTRVQVFEPWHVAALDTARRWLPRSRPMRALAAAGAVSVGSVMTLAAIFVAARLDLLGILGGEIAARASAAALAASGDLIAGAFGAPALEALRGSGTAGIGIGLGALMVAILVAASGLRRLSAVASSRRR